MLISLLFCLLRLSMVGKYFFHVNLGSIVFGVSELSAIMFTILGLIKGKTDKTCIGLLLPFLYSTPLLLQPSVASNQLTPILLATVASLQLVLRVLMGKRLTIGIATYVSPLTSFPWNIIRHPLSLVEFLMVTLFLLTFPTLWNVL